MVITQSVGLRKAVRSQKGFSLVEVSIVTAIVLLLAIIGIPAIGGYLVESKVPKVGEELARFVLQTTINATNVTAEPYADIDTAHFARLVRKSSIFSISESGGDVKVLHGLGAAGEVSVASADSGASFALTLSNVSHVACPSLASVMQRVAHTITVASDTQGATEVKSATTPYNALNAESRCGQGDVNTFVFFAG